MAWLKKKSDPISDRAHALNSEIAALEAQHAIIEIIKFEVPIWKKEIFVDGDVWVAAHP
jgi:molybdopterin synthase catalytic subunit